MCGPTRGECLGAESSKHGCAVHVNVACTVPASPASCVVLCVNTATGRDRRWSTLLELHCSGATWLLDDQDSLADVSGTMACVGCAPLHVSMFAVQVAQLASVTAFCAPS